LGPSIIPYTRLNSKWIQGKNVNNKTIKVLKEHMGEFLYNPGVGKAFLVAAHNPEARKENIRKNWIHYLKNKKLLHSQKL